MKISPRKRRAIYTLALSDYFTATLAWLLFYLYRQNALSSLTLKAVIAQITGREILIGVGVIPLFWLAVYTLAGTYFDLYRKSRLNEINRTLISCLLGTVIIAMFTIGNDNNDYRYFIQMTGRYLLLHTIITLIARLLLLNAVKRNIKEGKVGYKTLLLGGGAKAMSLYQTLLQNQKVLGYQYQGFVYTDQETDNEIEQYLPKLGALHQLENIIVQHEIEEVIVAVDSSEHHLLENILTRLSYNPVVIKVMPDLYDIISGSVKTSNVYGTLLIPIYPELMPDWQRVFKRLIDIIVSLSALIFLSWLYIFSAIKVRLSSPGNLIYKQKRIGLYGQPFYILKFRSMYQDSEKLGPALSSKEDERITPWGKIMRKWRIDEIPQFVNILKGEMSLVGPRPERQHYIDIISQKHPYYRYLHKVKPGLTSWGMVKFGYAENVDQMIERMKYDLLYIENCSLVLDIKILLYTFMVIVEGRGK